MALDDESDGYIDEDWIERDPKTGEIIFALRFVSKEAKDDFLSVIAEMTAKAKRNKEEGYTCGNCAAYPCFRARGDASRPAGLCFQHVRQCRQECDFYNQKETGEFWPNGICRKDNSKVIYNQECHIDEVKRSRLQIIL
jgi:hypothetical protein